LVECAARNIEVVKMSATPAAQISYGDFEKIDVRVGTIVTAEPFPQARKPAYKLTIDFGEVVGIKRSSAQITANHKLEQLVGRQVLAVVNFPPRQIGPFMSEVLTLGLPDGEGAVMLIGPSGKVPDGGRMF
jgi:tRNA-binding protein